MRAALGGPSNARLPAITGHYDDGRELVFESAVDEAETLGVEHVDFVDEEDARDYFGFAFFAPFGDFGVDLLADFGADLACVAAEEGEEALCSAVDYVDFVEGDGVDYLSAHLELAFGALDEFGVGAHGVVVSAAGVGAAELGDSTGCFVDADDVAGHDFLFSHAVDHLRAHVVYGFHVCGLDGEFPLLVALQSQISEPFNVRVVFETCLLYTSPSPRD